MGEFGFIQTVEENMEMFNKRQIAGAVQVRNLFNKLIYLSTADFQATVSTGGIPGYDVTINDAKVAEAIWGHSVLKMKGNTIRKNATQMTQSIVKVPTELIKLHQNVELAIDVFFINKHIFFITFSTKICFTTITHLTSHNKKMIWEALHLTYKMYLLRGFRIIVIKGDQEFVSISDQVVTLPKTPSVDWADAVQHCGFIKRNIRFMKEKVRSLRHSLPFVHVLAIMVIRMVLHTVKFVNGFPRQGGPKYYLPGQIMTGRAYMLTTYS
jgi:hypothetical protein